MESLRNPDTVKREEDDLACRRADAEVWVESFQRPVRDCYADLGLDFGNLPSMTLEEQELLPELRLGLS
jgi:hypothetical protein